MNKINFKQFKKLAMVRSFIELYQHYFQIYLVWNGYFSKNIPYRIVRRICEDFCEVMHIPSSVLGQLQSKEIGIDELRMIDMGILEMLGQISESEVRRAFSQLTALKVL